MSYNPLQLAAILATLTLRGVLDYWILVKSGEYVCNCQSTNRKKNLWPYIKRDMPTTQIALCLFNTAMENCPIIDDVCWFTFKNMVFSSSRPLKTTIATIHENDLVAKMLTTLCSRNVDAIHSSRQITWAMATHLGSSMASRKNKPYRISPISLDVEGLRGTL